MTLDEEQIRALTGYKQHARQHRWIKERLRIEAPLRADGLPVVTQAQIDAALAGKKTQANGPKWSTS